MLHPTKKPIQKHKLYEYEFNILLNLFQVSLNFLI